MGAWKNFTADHLESIRKVLPPVGESAPAQVCPSCGDTASALVRLRQPLPRAVQDHLRVVQLVSPLLRRDHGDSGVGPTGPACRIERRRTQGNGERSGIVLRPAGRVLAVRAASTGSSASTAWTSLRAQAIGGGGASSATCCAARLRCWKRGTGAGYVRIGAPEVHLRRTGPSAPRCSPDWRRRGPSRPAKCCAGAVGPAFR